MVVENTGRLSAVLGAWPGVILGFYEALSLCQGAYSRVGQTKLYTCKRIVIIEGTQLVVVEWMIVQRMGQRRITQIPIGYTGMGLPGKAGFR